MQSLPEENSLGDRRSRRRASLALQGAPGAGERRLARFGGERLTVKLRPMRLRTGDHPSRQAQREHDV